MTVLLELPPECIIRTLSLLKPPQIARCQMISHAFWNLISDSLELQYLLELHYLRYVAPHAASENPLPLDERIRALKEKRLKRSAPDAACATTIPLEPQDHGSVGFGVVGSHTFSRGTLVWQGRDGDQLGVYRLSSRNRGLDSSHYILKLHSEYEIAAIEPLLDLLVLFAVTEDGATFRVCSLETGLPHPAAVHPVIRYASYSEDTNIRHAAYDTVQVEIIGRRLVHMGETLGTLSLVTVLDWASGQILTSTEVAGYSVAFLSEEIFVVATRMTPDTRDIPPLLALYTCDGVLPGDPAKLVVHLHFPPLSPTVQMQWPDFLPSTLPSIEGSRVPFARALPPFIYDMCSTSHYLVLLTPVVITQPELPNLDATYNCGTLLIHASSLLELAGSLTAGRARGGYDNTSPSIPWSGWNSMTSWISHRETCYPCCPSISGHLVACLYGMEELAMWQVCIYDLRRETKETSQGRDYRQTMIESFFGDGSQPARAPLLVTSFSIPFTTIPWEKDWEESENHYCPVELLIDDEHVVIFRTPSNNVQASIHVY
ncbi:hypothetical protein RSAG8_04584, partial [Rhizoctonia solani AG-8 WAC10335]